ncbi:MAG: hypothetical protein GTO22_19595 [Gemmatimonadales bacterium]|nr:hypothetical protein [Gemmatimonadales bacterium]
MTAVDLVTRFVLPFNLKRVLTVEAALFFGAAFVALALVIRSPWPDGWRRVVQWLLVGSFALAALRAAVWAAGLPVAWANRLVLVVAAVTVLLTWLWRRLRRHTIEPV